MCMKPMHTPATITTLVLLLWNSITVSDGGDSKSFPSLERKCMYLILLLSLSCRVMTISQGCLHIWVPLCAFYHSVSSLSVSSVTSTGINSSHGGHTLRYWWPPQVHPRREQRLHFPPSHVTYTDMRLSALWCFSTVTYLSKNLVIPFSTPTCSCRQQTWGNKELGSDTFS